MFARPAKWDAKDATLSQSERITAQVIALQRQFLEFFDFHDSISRDSNALPLTDATPPGPRCQQLFVETVSNQ
jgi:hypothetical protein